MKKTKYFVGFIVVFLFVLAFSSCKKDNVENVDMSVTDNEMNYGKGMGTGDVPVVFMGVKQYYTFIMPDGSVIVQMYCLPPYPNNVCATFNVPEEAIKNGNSQGVEGTVVLHGMMGNSDEIPTEVELPVRQCVLDVANNSAKFIID